jgi:serine/threonine-protein kinase
MSARLLSGTIVANRYEIVRLLGRGGMAEIYLASELASGREVALKALSTSAALVPELCSRLEREAAVTRNIVHPNVVAVEDVGHLDDGSPFLIAEMLLGETLGQYLAREGRMEPARVVRLVWQAASALAAAHRAGVVHRDVKPDNLFLCGPVGTPRLLKVFDFGLAKITSALRATPTMIVKGTLEYMAPEQILAEPIDGRADVYALGVVMFRALTGELPFEGGPMTQLLRHHLRSPAPPPSWLADDVSTAVDDVVLTALRKNPANRYPGMDDMLQDLRRLIGQDSSVVGAPLLVDPDRYVPRTELGQRAFALLEGRLDVAPLHDVVAA